MRGTRTSHRHDMMHDPSEPLNLLAGKRRKHATANRSRRRPSATPHGWKPGWKAGRGLARLVPKGKRQHVAGTLGTRTPCPRGKRLANQWRALCVLAVPVVASSRGWLSPPPLCHGRGDTRSFRPPSPCAQSSPKLSRAALARMCCRSCGLVPTFIWPSTTPHHRHGRARLPVGGGRWTLGAWACDDLGWDGVLCLTRAFPDSSSPVSSAITRPCGPVTVTACRPCPSSRSQCAEWLITAFACEWVWQLWSSRQEARETKEKRGSKRSGGIGS